MRQHIVLVTQSSFCAVRHRSSSVLTRGQPTVVTSTRLITVSEAWCRSVYSNYQSAIRTTFGSGLLRHGLIFSKAWWTMWLISGEKTESMHPCRRWLLWMYLWRCDVACLTCKLSHNTTGFFQSRQRLDGNKLPSTRRISSAFHEIVQWHFFRCDQQVDNHSYNSFYSEIT